MLCEQPRMGSKYYEPGLCHVAASEGKLDTALTLLKSGQNSQVSTDKFNASRICLKRPQKMKPCIGEEKTDPTAHLHTAQHTPT